MTDIAERAISPDLEQDSSGNATSATRTFSVLNELDEATALADFQASLGPVFLGLNLQNSSLETIEGTDGWIGVANYSDVGTKTENQILTGGGIIERFDISSRTIRLMNSISTNRYQTFDSVEPVGPPTNKNRDETPNLKNLIQVNNDGVVQGADIEISQFGFTLTKQYAAIDINIAFKRLLLQATNNVNSVLFRGWFTGELRLHSIQDQDAGSNNVNITYRFLVSENRTAAPAPDDPLDVGDVENVDKLGHEYLWIKYQDKRDDVANALIRIPEFVYVEKVYEDFDFNNATLGIG